MNPETDHRNRDPLGPDIQSDILLSCLGISDFPFTISCQEGHGNIWSCIDKPDQPKPIVPVYELYLTELFIKWEIVQVNFTGCPPVEAWGPCDPAMGYNTHSAIQRQAWLSLISGLTY